MAKNLTKSAAHGKVSVFNLNNSIEHDNDCPESQYSYLVATRVKGHERCGALELTPFHVPFFVDSLSDNSRQPSP